MAHFAKVDPKTKKVVDVIVINDEDCNGGTFPESEVPGQKFILELSKNNLLLKGNWFQTSYNNNFRGIFGQVGSLFDKDYNNGEGKFYNLDF